MRNLIVGYDGSRSSEACLRQAIPLAQGFDARLHLLQTLEPVGPAHAIALEESDDPVAYIDRMEERNAGEKPPPVEDEDGLADAVRVCEEAGVVCTWDRPHGMARRVLLERAVGMDLLAIGRRGTVGRKKIGDTAAGVVGQPTGPTLICRDEVVPWDRILLCYEPSTVGGRALQAAGALASGLNITLDVVVAAQSRDAARKNCDAARNLLRAYHVEGEDVHHVGRLTDAVQSAAFELESSTVIVPLTRHWPWSRSPAVEAALDFPGAITLIVP